MTKIQVLGPGCARCVTLYENVLAVVRERGLSCEVEKVTDMQQIVAAGVLSTPALVIDGQVRSAGRVLTPEQIKPLLG